MGNQQIRMDTGSNGVQFKQTKNKNGKTSFQSTQKQNVMLTRYPGILTDWHGQYIDNDIRRFIGIGNIVRIPFEYPSGATCVGYFRILKRCDKNRKMFVGVCQDDYYGNDPNHPIRNGDQRVFSAQNVMEIPLTWEGNKNLQKKARLLNKNRGGTGIVQL